MTRVTFENFTAISLANAFIVSLPPNPTGPQMTQAYTDAESGAVELADIWVAAGHVFDPPATLSQLVLGFIRAFKSIDSAKPGVITTAGGTPR